MATQSFDNSIKVDKKSVKSFVTILNSDKKMIISRESIAKDADVKKLHKFLRK